MIRVADVVMRYLAERGVRDVFTVSGGGIMHLIDALGSAPGLRYRVNNHEQASAIAAESYARVTGGLGACLVTTGPGSTNALSALAGAYVDSIPVLCIAGQVRREVMADYARQRQYGPQEIDIAPMVAPVTKYQTILMDPQRVLVELETACAIATSGRPGPVWITVPLDVQAALVDETALAHADLAHVVAAPVPPAASAIERAVAMLRAAERPLLIGGAGVRVAAAQDAFRALAHATGIPALLTIGAMDLLPEDHPQYLGKFGPVGQRRANFALQNADLLLSVGASMSISSIGFNTESFAPHARRIMVNVDRGELDKANYRPDLAIEADAGAFLRALVARVAREPLAPSRRWLDACERWKERYPIVGAEQRVDPAFVSTYAFVDALSEALAPGDVVVTGNSLDAASVYQAFRVRDGQRVFTNVNFGAMGWDLPAAIGAAAARPGARTILVTGDGSIQFNVQELMTAAVNALELKIFVVNNDGYESIRATQDNHFAGRHVGSDFASGIGNPDFALLARAYGLGYLRAERDDDVPGAIAGALARPGPVLVELRVSPVQGRIPKVSSFRRPDGSLESKPLHDMFPWLPPEEIAENVSLFAATTAAAN
ncbi:MAG TPA: thiamine pyrophosphate-binding protein [Candidatus Baltobacteraceae bacterium]|nr:thiamine pyrophosphate-binding protein [Candidatus Baltobacteraceae bacterium]